LVRRQGRYGGLPAVPPLPSYEPLPGGGPYGPTEVGPGPPLPPGGAGARRVRPLVAGALVAVVAVGAATGWWFAHRDEPAPDARGSASSLAPDPTGPTDGANPDGPSASAGTSRSPSTSPSAGASRSGSASPGGTAAAPDEPREVVQDPKGFALAVPAGWRREESGASVFYRSSDRAALIQVFPVSEPDLTPVQAVERASADLRSRTSGYTEIRVGAVTGGGGELVYEYASEESRGRRRGVERVLLAPDGTKWAVLVAGPAAEWPLTQSRQEAALRAFRPGN
ncbi:hypothetical protein, partial [Streptomyces sp. WAC06614]|uniref:hypothetical protein n=1 Tax=Streptomyces sp. WAC06614 TaxID=2487416 RepID=UPI00163B8CF7